MGYWKWAGLVVVPEGEEAEEGAGGMGGEEEDGLLLEAARGEEGATVAVGMAEGGRTVVKCWVVLEKWCVSGSRWASRDKH